MDGRRLEGKQSSKEVTEVITRNISAGHERDYDDWLRCFMISERQFPGYIGTTVIAPGGRKMAIVSFIGAYRISLLAQYILGLYLRQSPLLTNTLMTIILVLGLTYFAMPLLSRLL